MRRGGWIYRLAVVVLVVSLVCLAAGWAVCLFGTSDDGLHCVPAVLATVIMGPLLVLSAVGTWAKRRRPE